MSLQTVLFSFSPILLFRVSGRSMIPNFLPGDIVIVLNKKFSQVCKHEAIVLYDPRTGKPILKRIQKVKDNSYFVVGDNTLESTDSRNFGWVLEHEFIGKVIYKI